MAFAGRGVLVFSYGTIARRQRDRLRFGSPRSQSAGIATRRPAARRRAAKKVTVTAGRILQVRRELDDSSARYQPQAVEPRKAGVGHHATRMSHGPRGMLLISNATCMSHLAGFMTRSAPAGQPRWGARQNGGFGRQKAIRGAGWPRTHPGLVERVLEPISPPWHVAPGGIFGRLRLGETFRW
jgi:hypothetical protein